jgi:hypothetical protein
MLLSVGGNSASASIVWARPVNRRKESGNWSALKYYPLDNGQLDPNSVSKEEAEAISTELWIYRYTDLLVQDRVTPNICYMYEAMRHRNPAKTLQTSTVRSAIVSAGGGIPPGQRYTIVPTTFRRGAKSLESAIQEKSTIDDFQLGYVLMQVLYTLECMARIGVEHLDLHLGNVMLYPDDETDMKKVRQYTYIDRARQLHQLYVPFYGWVPRIYDFDRGCKWEPPVIMGHVPLTKFSGIVGNGLLKDPSLSTIVGPFLKGLDPAVDSAKFLFSLAILPMLNMKRSRADVLEWSQYRSLKPRTERSFTMGGEEYVELLYFDYPVRMEQRVDMNIKKAHGNIVPVASRLPLEKMGVKNSDEILRELAGRSLFGTLGSRTIAETYSMESIYDGAPALSGQSGPTTAGGSVAATIGSKRFRNEEGSENEIESVGQKRLRYATETMNFVTAQVFRR